MTTEESGEMSVEMAHQDNICNVRCPWLIYEFTHGIRDGATLSRNCSDTVSTYNARISLSGHARRPRIHSTLNVRMISLKFDAYGYTLGRLLQVILRQGSTRVISGAKS